tara:strand:- start:965 stop:1360 length:396 start_codon:yes stop_codon:yes gene_type:complete
MSLDLGLDNIDIGKSLSSAVEGVPQTIGDILRALAYTPAGAGFFSLLMGNVVLMSRQAPPKTSPYDVPYPPTKGTGFDKIIWNFSTPEIPIALGASIPALDLRLSVSDVFFIGGLLAMSGGTASPILRLIK